MRRILACSTRVYYRDLSIEDAACIRHDLELYNKMLHTAYRWCYDCCFYGKSNKELEKKLKDKYGTSDYMPLSAINEARGLLKSNIEKNKADKEQTQQVIENINDKIKAKEIELAYYIKEQERLIQKSKDMDYTEADYLYEVRVVKPKTKELRNQLSQLRFRKNRTAFKLAGLCKRMKQVCFGGKKNLINDKETYRFRRSNRMLIPGRRQGKYSNNLFKYHVDENIMVYRGSDHDIELNIDFPYHKEELVRAVKLPHNTPDKAVAYQLEDHGAYFVIKAIIQAPDKAIKFDSKYGAIGLDLNIDHFALVETNKDGNIVGRRTIRFDLRKKNRHQRKHILRECAKEIVQYCKQQRRPLVIEELNFTKKEEQDDVWE